MLTCGALPSQSRSATRHHLRHRNDHCRCRSPRDGGTPFDIRTRRVIGRIFARRRPPRCCHRPFGDRRGYGAGRRCEKSPLLTLG
jgi:hypothetical protein